MPAAWWTMTDELKAEGKHRSAHLLTVLTMYSTHVTATGRSVLLHERKAVRWRHVMQPEHRGKIPSWVAPARRQCSTFPLVIIIIIMVFSDWVIAAHYTTNSALYINRLVEWTTKNRGAMDYLSHGLRKWVIAAHRSYIQYERDHSCFATI